MSARAGSGSTPRLSIKFLVPNGLAGSLIGTGGAAIKELIDVTKAKVLVSGITDVYPGTSERIILVSGNEDAVDAAQTLVWNMIGLNVKAEGDKTVSWSPRASSESPEEHEDVTVTGKISIPASAGGLVLGRGGASIKAIGEESGAQIQLTSKEEAIFTQERIMTIQGTPNVCAKCVSLVLGRLSEDLDAAQYVNRGVTYTSHVGPIFGGGMSPGEGRSGGRGARAAAAAAAAAGGGGLTDGTIANTTISLQVPDSLVGNILGKQGSTMREIMSLSGAKVVVSPRGEYAEGSTDRTVTITGSPVCAQTAHLFVTQKLQQPTAGGRPRRSPRDTSA